MQRPNSDWIPAILSILLFCIGCAVDREEVERQIGVRVTSDMEIPRGFETYTLFLTLSREYAAESSVHAIDELATRFDAFGKDIGEDNAAILFQNVRGGLDVSRSKDIADHLVTRYPGLRLRYNDSPLIVILNHHPYEPPGPDGVAVAMSFANISPTRIGEALNFIEEAVRRREIFQRNLDFYQRWLEVKSWLEGVDVAYVKELVIEIIKVAA